MEETQQRGPGRPGATPEEIAKVIELRLEGKSPKAIRDLTEMGLTKIYEIIRNNPEEPNAQ